MRDYNQVNIERYEKDDFSGKGIEKNIYSSINPVGNYGLYKIQQISRKFIRDLRRKTKKEYDKIHILDCGCGTGLWTRTMANYCGTPENIYGFEYSQNRLDYCKKMNPAINYRLGNIVGGVYDEYDFLFDGIISIDVLSQLRKENDIFSALSNINKKLSPNGLFLWYEINAKTHHANFDADSQGFSENEMDKYAETCEMKLVEKTRIFGQIKCMGKSFSTYYNVDDNHKRITLMELVDPFLCRFNQ